MNESPARSHRTASYNSSDATPITSSDRSISTFYTYNGNNSSYVFFVKDTKNIYIETLLGSIIIPFKDIQKYNRLYIYYIISLQITPFQTKIYYCTKGYKGIYKERRNWYILTNICWKSLYMSYGDFCYFKDNPLTIDLHNYDTCDTIKKYIIDFNNRLQDPYKIIDWLINFEIKNISNEIYKNEIVINRDKNTYDMLVIIQEHFNITDDIILKIFHYINEDNIKIYNNIYKIYNNI